LDRRRCCHLRALLQLKAPPVQEWKWGAGGAAIESLPVWIDPVGQRPSPGDGPWHSDTGAEGLFPPCIKPRRLGPIGRRNRCGWWAFGGEQQVNAAFCLGWGSALGRPRRGGKKKNPVPPTANRFLLNFKWRRIVGQELLHIAPPALAALKSAGHHAQACGEVIHGSPGVVASPGAGAPALFPPSLARGSNLAPHRHPSRPLPLSNGCLANGPVQPERPLPLGLRPDPPLQTPRPTGCGRLILPSERDWPRPPGTPGQELDLGSNSNRCQRPQASCWASAYGSAGRTTHL